MPWLVLVSLLMLNACQSTSGQKPVAPAPASETTVISTPNEKEKPKVVDTNVVEEIKAMNGASAEDGYFIDGQKVDRASFEKFRASLTPVEGTYFCDEMDTGGVSGEDLRSAEGGVYSYEMESTDRSRTSLTRRK